MSDPPALDALSVAAWVARVGPFALVTSWVGLRTLPHAARLALAGAIAVAAAPAADLLRPSLSLALAQGTAAALGALAPLAATVTALEATTRLADLPRSWDAALALLVALSFLLLGGPLDVARAVTAAGVGDGTRALALAVAGGVTGGLALAAPMLVGRVGVEVVLVASARAELGRTWIVARKLALMTLAALVLRRLVARAL
ncbi:MAG: hypothetical protein IT374_18785 [Polyangiaceae bacterium]|nr:hypothetical protein [Polyangiaceae bacterium]